MNWFTPTPMQHPILPSNLQWSLELDKTWDVLGPFPIHAREQHFFTPSFPLNLSHPIDYNQSWQSSYADGGLVNWTQTSSDNNGNLEIVFPSIRWKNLRAIEGWAALQHHAVLRTSITVYPPTHPINSEPAPRLLVDLEQGSYFALRPYSDSNFSLKWYAGNIYALERALAHVVDMPTVPSSREPTKYDLFISGDYEIRLFGDPLVHQRDFPIQKLKVKVQLQNARSVLVRQESHDVMCNFVSGYAFGKAIGVGLQSQAHWWTVNSIRLKEHVPGLILKIKDRLTIAPSQTRSVPISIEQSQPFFGEHINVIITLSSGDMSQEVSISIPLVHRRLFSSAPQEPIKGTYFFAESMATSFLAVPPQDTEGFGGVPILALHGAGVDILAQDFWVHSLPNNGKSWVVVPSGRTSWGLDWHGPSAQDAWTSLAALSEISRAEAQAFPMSWKVPADSKAIVIGHSNGGQGAWYFVSRYPDKVLAAIPASGYIKSQAYVPLTLARSGHFIDPALRFILESSLTPDDNDLHLSNLVDTPILAIHGGDDENVPSWHSREATSTLKTWYPQANIEFKEDRGEGHWYPHVLKNPEVDAFLIKVTSGSNNATPSDQFTLTVTIPHINGSLHGWSIDDVYVPGRLSRLTVRKIGDSRYGVVLSNVHAFTVPSEALEVYVDGNLVVNLSRTVETVPIQIYQSGVGEWRTRLPSIPGTIPIGSHGRMQNILSTNGPMIIVISSRSNRQDLSAALRIAHVLDTYHRLDAEIITEDIAITWSRDDAWPTGNVVFIGTSSSLFAKEVLKMARTDVTIVNSATFVGKYKFNNPGQATLFLHPHPSEEPSSCMMFILYTDQTSLERALRLFPFRTGVAVPDWLIVGGKMDTFGAGGIEGAGVWNNEWKLSEPMSWFDR